MQPLFGFLNVNKPPGITSRDVVNQVQRLVRPAKVGHAGTLDPLATGVLVVCIGPATRLTDYIHQCPKRYVGGFLLGRRSNTEDIEGEVELIDNARRPTQPELKAAVRRFQGEIQQLPPQFSALKVKGKRAHDLARKGVQVDLKARPVTIHECRLLGYEYPRFDLEVACSSGTYIRSLGRDIAQFLESGAVMCELNRTAVGEFRVEEACELEQLTSSSIEQFLAPPRLAVAALPFLQTTEAERKRLARGMDIENQVAAQTGEVAAFDDDGRLVSILRIRPDGRLAPAKNLLLRS